MSAEPPQDDPRFAERMLRLIGSKFMPMAERCETDRELAMCVSATMPNDPRSIAPALLSVFAARWAQFAFPVLDLRMDQVASLSLTDSDPSKIEIIPPWSAYLIRLAEGSYPVRAAGPSGVETSGQVTNVCVMSYTGPDYETKHGVPFSSGYHEIHMLTDVEGVALHGGTRTLAEMYSNCEFEQSEGKFTLGELEVRSVGMGMRLVLSSMVAASSHGVLRATPRRAKGKRWVALSAEQRGTFLLGTPVTIGNECSKELHAYLRGDASITRRSRWVVRGHWRNQPFGPGRTERKHIWIQPHWAGPEHMPPRVKDYRL
jgi:hypothetical protein